MGEAQPSPTFYSEAQYIWYWIKPSPYNVLLFPKENYTFILCAFIKLCDLLRMSNDRFCYDNLALFCLHLLNCYQQIKWICKNIDEDNIIQCFIVFPPTVSNLLGIPLKNSILEIMKRKRNSRTRNQHQELLGHLLANQMALFHYGE